MFLSHNQTYLSLEISSRSSATIAASVVANTFRRTNSNELSSNELFSKLATKDDDSMMIYCGNSIGSINGPGSNIEHE